MLQDLHKQGERRLAVSSESMRQWSGSVMLAITVAIAYFLASRLSFFLRTKPDDIAWFWPAAGVAAGVLIALGPGTTRCRQVLGRAAGRRDRAAPATAPRRKLTRDSRAGHLTLRFTADIFPRFSSISYSICCPSLSELRPARSTAEI